MLQESSISQAIKPRFMRSKQAAAYLGVSETTIWRLVKAGSLPAPIKQSSRCVLFETAWLDAYADRLANGGAQA